MKRVDILVCEQGLFTSRSKAQQAITAGIVAVAETQETVLKASEKYVEDTKFILTGEPLLYVSRGGLKLAAALTVFQITLTDKIVLDIGASTGGFTDCALQFGAQFVYALDVGTEQLVPKLKADARVLSLEQVNFRYTDLTFFTKGLPNVLVADVSFISLTHIFKQVNFLFQQEEFTMIALIKPQFEVDSATFHRQGIIKNPKIHQQVITKITTCIQQYNWNIHGIIESPIQGQKGNKEFLLCFSNKQ